MTAFAILRLVVAGAVVIVWGITVIVGATGGDSPSTAVNGVMLLVAGWLFGPLLADRFRNGNGAER